jgi:hypothetical protein
MTMPVGIKYRYWVSDPEDDLEFFSTWEEDWPEYVAEDAAQDYHQNHDGWEASWPLEITLLHLDGTLIGKFSVDRDYDPVFSARKLK